MNVFFNDVIDTLSVIESIQIIRLANDLFWKEKIVHFKEYRLKIVSNIIRLNSQRIGSI
jgi:hypothetical protein